MRVIAATAATCAAVLLAVAVAGCGGTGSSTATKETGTPAAEDKTPVTLQVWSFFTGREQKLVEKQLANFHAQYPWVTVKYVGGQADDKTITAIRGGSGPDLTLAQGSENVMAWCASGAWQDMAPMIKRDKVDMEQFPAAVAGDGVRDVGRPVGHGDTLVRRFSAFAWPATVDLTSPHVYQHEGHVLLGGIYADWMRQQTAIALPDPIVA